MPSMFTAHVITVQQQPFLWRGNGYGLDGHGNYISILLGHEHNIFVVSSIIHSIGLGNWSVKSVLMESILIVLLHIDINRDSMMTPKQSVLYQVSIISESVEVLLHEMKCFV